MLDQGILIPQLCQECKGGRPLPTGDQWVMEPKLDGWRFLFHRGPDRVKSYAGRNGSNRTGQPALVEAALAFLPADTVVDCELIVVGGAVSVNTVLADPRMGKLQAVAFDLLALAGTDVRRMPWTVRRGLLEKAAEGFDGVNVVLGEVHDLDMAVHDSWVAAGREGSVLKRKQALYSSGRRSWDWIKVKPQSSAEAVVTGWVHGKGASNQQKCGALEVRMIDGGVETTVGYDCSPAQADRLVGRVIEMLHHGIQPSGKPRHPVFFRVRDDRSPAEGVPVSAPQVRTQNRNTPAKPAKLPRETGRKSMRNYKSMNPAKLAQCVSELEAAAGDAYDRVAAGRYGGSVAEHLDAASAALPTNA